MHPNSLIDFETMRGRDRRSITRRLYITEFPVALKENSALLFDILDQVSQFFRVPIFEIRIAGSAQTGTSFHSDRDFRPGESDLDLAVVSGSVFERYLRAAQAVVLPNPDSLERPQQNQFPSIKGVSTYREFMEKVTFHGVLMPHLMPICQERAEISRFMRRVSQPYAHLFREINIALYLSLHFFETKQQPNISFYLQKVMR